MILKHQIAALTCSFFLVTSPIAHANNSDLNQMHAIYKACVGADGTIKCFNKQGKEDYKKLELMTTLMKSILMAHPHDATVLAQVLSVYQQAYDTLNSHQLSPEWNLPSKILDMNITARLTLTNKEQYSIAVRGLTQQPKVIKQLQIVQYPNKVMVDKNAGIGQWWEHQDGSRYTYGIESKRSPHKIKPGLYTLSIELENGSKTNGWFLVDKEMLATTAPTVQNPAQGELFSTGTPTFNWLNYVSLQYKPYESRWFWAGVSKVEPTQGNWDATWSIYQANPTIQQATIGVNGSFYSAQDHQLAPGNYVVTFSYKELKSFGTIEVGRGADTQLEFEVKP